VPKIGNEKFTLSMQYACIIDRVYCQKMSFTRH